MQPFDAPHDGRVESGPGRVDGRVARGERTRRSIVEALVELLMSGEPRPTARQIAEAAGVSVRSIFQHFDDLEGLYGDLVRVQSERVQPLVDSLERDGDLARRIDALVAQRAALFEAITPMRHAVGTRASESKVIARRISDVSEVLHHQVAHQFAEELTGPDAEPLSLALDSMCAFETWDRLRNHHGQDVEQAAGTLRVALTRLLA